MKRNLILIVLGILLALAGTGSAYPSLSCTPSNCHNFDGNFFYNTHKFDGISAPTVSTSCAKCHVNPPDDMSLTSSGSLYNSNHRYNASTLASVNLAAPACGNCHVDVINNDFTRLSGTPNYLTSATCENCHKAKYDNWTNTLHRVMLTEKSKAQAMNLPEPEVGWANISYVIVTKFEFAYINTTGYFPAQNDAYETETQEFVNSSHAGGAYGTCGRCHTTNWNASARNSSLPGFNGTFSEPGIACERCHKPAGNGHQVEINYSGNQCRECHTGGNHGTGWENGGHTAAEEHMDSNPSCTTCHSPFDKYKTGNVSVENASAVSCGICHNIHDMTDNKYAETFSEGNFNATSWSEVADSKLSFFNATASVAAGTDVFDDLKSIVLIKQGRDLTNRPVSEKLCSSCHFNHGLAHMANVNMTHANGQATCIDCHMEGANAKLGKGMMKNHDNVIDSGKSCGGVKCHGRSEKTPIDPLVGNGSESMQKRFDEWGATLHNDKEVGRFAGPFNDTTGIGKSRANNCLVCHDPMNYNPTEKYNYTPVPLTEETFKGITCMVCHNLHDMGDWFNATFNLFGEEKAYGLYEKILVGSRYKGTYRLVENTTELCGSCHSNDHPRLKEVGSYAEPGWPFNASNPNSAHGFPAAELFVGSWKQTVMGFECTTCHYATMSRYENGTSMPQNERIRGHTFQVNATILMNNSYNCYTCHITGTELGDLSTTVENIQAETHDKWNATNITVLSALATIKAYNGEKNLSRDLIAQAYWNLRLVSSDESWGVHNPVKVNNLLNESITLANDSITALGETTKPVLTTIMVSPSIVTLFMGDNKDFTATALDQNGDPMEGINVAWTSSDLAVGTVSPESAMTGADGTATSTFTANAVGTSMVNATNGSVVGSAEVVVTEEIEEINLIKNPSFESGRQNWIFYTNGTGKFNIISPGFEGNNAAEVKLGKIGSNIQLYYKGLTLKPNTHYRLSFAAKSSRGHDVEVVLLKHGSPYTNYGLKQNFNLTKDWQTFTTEFDTKRFIRMVDDGRLMFYLSPFAKAGDKYYFDSVKLEEVS